jgi:hypothetical protein
LRDLSYCLTTLCWFSKRTGFEEFLRKTHGTRAPMNEASLYPLVKDWLDAGFARVRRGQWHDSYRKSMITAQLNWIDGGAWMRPDLALVHIHRRRFEPVASLDLYTIEVKPPGSATLPGLHQTLAHGRFADFVLLVTAKPSAPNTEVEAQAARFGVGLVQYENPEVWDSYSVLVEPQRSYPDPDLRHEFLTKALDSSGSTDEVLSWLRPHRDDRLTP